MPRIFVYRPDEGVAAVAKASEAKAVIEDPTARVWVDIAGRTPETDAVLSDVFGFHPLAIEDVYNERHRPKVEDYDTYLYIIVRSLTDTSDLERIRTVELDLFVGKNFVVTHHNGATTAVTRVIEDVARDGGPLAKGAAYLAHRLLDLTVDEFRLLPDHYMREVDRLEDVVLEGGDELARIVALKGALHRLCRLTSSQQQVLGRLARAEFDEIPDETRPFFRDVHEHMTQVTEAIENERDELNAVFDAYHSLSAHRMNEIMKVLTLISTIMLPLTFLAGVYGMNFDHMPELHWRYAYPALWAVMIAMSLGMTGYFRRRGWL